MVRLDGDDFMDAFAHMLAPEPKSGVAGPALWAARATRPWIKEGDKPANVLYQPLHGCYALVCASLTCRVAGRPDKSVAPAAGAEIGFVFRRRERDGAESGWVPAGSGIGEWKSIQDGTVVGEELIPMFPVPTSGPTPRRVWAALIPTASRETYQLRGQKPAADAPLLEVGEHDPRLEELDSGPGAALQTVLKVTPTGDAVADERRRKAARAQGLHALLGLAAFIVDKVAAPVPDGTTLTAALAANARTKQLAGALSVLSPWLDNAWSSQNDLIGASPHDQPTFDPVAIGLPLTADAWKPIREAVQHALPKVRPDPTGPPVGPPRPKLEPDFDPNQRQQYVVRCVYRRPGCPTAVSAASKPFMIAAVHEPDAPARTIRIPMPFDISVGGLRKFKRNVGFVLSESLNARVQSLSGVKLKDLDDGNVPDPGPGMAEICSFAIPIIALCAMIVLFIFLALLNIAFFWLPLVKICLPAPPAPGGNQS